jgi:polyisoprenoid-binding protein YceI
MARYEIQPNLSEVEINARSSLHPIDTVSHAVAGYVDIEFADGRLELDTTPSGHLSLRVNELSSGNALYDREMMKRIDARRFPEITGELTAIKVKMEDRYLVAGDLSFRGVTNHFEDEMRIRQTDENTVSLEGTHVFDVTEFDMQPPKLLMLKVYPEVKVSVKLVAQRSD